MTKKKKNTNNKQASKKKDTPKKDIETKEAKIGDVKVEQNKEQKNTKPSRTVSKPPEGKVLVSVYVDGKEVPGTEFYTSLKTFDKAYRNYTKNGKTYKIKKS